MQLLDIVKALLPAATPWLGPLVVPVEGLVAALDPNKASVSPAQAQAAAGAASIAQAVGVQPVSTATTISAVPFITAVYSIAEDIVQQTGSANFEAELLAGTKVVYTLAVAVGKPIPFPEAQLETLITTAFTLFIGAAATPLTAVTLVPASPVALKTVQTVVTQAHPRPTVMPQKGAVQVQSSHF